ncbi:MAG TPA: ABC transporter ATP-binding protein [Candidatus Scatomorpha stercorigallinarum]|nr:ABC transporter ATP-binding protein [Candidatus Scatomorpha stercorigallinarum]
MAELTLHRVSYRYPRAARDALQGVECRFRAGEVAAVVGPSGSGKTTLLSIMAGLDRPSGGEVLVNDKKLSEMNLDAYRRQYVSVIFQAFHLFPLLTVLENVCFPLELLGAGEKDAREQARRNLELVGIAEEKHRRYPSQLSGGEQQRVAIARALSSGAGILLADEPTGNLDGENSRNIVDILTRLAHEGGYCVVIVTHDPAIAEAADAVYTVADGELSRMA